MRVWPYLATAILICGSLRLTALAQTDESSWGKSTPGVELATHEGPREGTSSGTLLIYNILGRGFPADKTYDLWFWRLGKKPEKGMQGVSFDKRGVLVCSGKPGSCKGEGADDPSNIKANAALGEPKRFGIFSSDGKVAGFAEAVPFPIEAKDKSCKLSVVRQSPLAEVVAVRASGFAPSEMLTVKTNLASEPMQSSTASPDGSWQAMMNTKSLGTTAGVASIQVSGKGCSVSVSFNWGEGSNKLQ